MENQQPMSLRMKFFLALALGWLLAFFLASATSASSFPNDSKSFTGKTASGTSATVATVPSGHTWTLLETCITSSVVDGEFQMTSGSTVFVYIYSSSDPASQHCTHPYSTLSAGSTIIVSHPSGWTTGYSITYVDYDLSLVPGGDNSAVVDAINELKDENTSENTSLVFETSNMSMWLQALIFILIFAWLYKAITRNIL